MSCFTVGSPRICLEIVSLFCLLRHVAILLYQVSETLKMLDPTALQWRIAPIGVKEHLENPKHYLLGVRFGPSLSHSTVAHSPVSLLSGEKLMVPMKP